MPEGLASGHHMYGEALERGVPLLPWWRRHDEHWAEMVLACSASGTRLKLSIYIDDNDPGDLDD
jgi:hypothetical protein